MAVHDEKIAALEEAIAGGVLTVESDGDRITYRSITDMMTALNYLKTQQTAAGPASRRSATTLAVFDGS